MKKGSGYPILHVSIFNASFVSTGMSAEQIELFHKQAAQVVGDVTGINPDQVLVEIKSKPSIDNRKRVLDPPMSVFCIWDDRIGESDRDNKVIDAIFSLVEQEFGVRHNPRALTTVMVKIASVLVVSHADLLKFLLLRRARPLR